MSSTIEKVVTVQNPMGIHMRPADLLSRAAGRFQCQIEIEKDGQAIDCKSIMSILTLGARQGSQLSLRACGVDAQEAIDALSELFNQGFDESDSEVASPGRP
ncbi:HPr family phosphocarrier protein [Aureliella helgolandensis]|uniref:Phosphocarrier protein HPr n=1 Tax=Aureliella helgolandensis TaxID=2527968 RepID=A0A518G673_9BACT|nr:HPr family phosphocarrier protein [Aureliella helgolandensis]QDV24082.1 Phosphocarrier protein HPr [Aureliella helgolandensis]